MKTNVQEMKTYKITTENGMIISIKAEDEIRAQIKLEGMYPNIKTKEIQQIK